MVMLYVQFNCAGICGVGVMREEKETNFHQTDVKKWDKKFIFLDFLEHKNIVSCVDETSYGIQLWYSVMV